MKYKEIYDHVFSHVKYNSENIDLSPSYGMIKEWLVNNTGKTLIDVGCGRGFITAKIMEDFPDLEISTADLGKYHTLSTEHFDLDMSGDGREKITKIYDFLISNGVLEHIDIKDLDISVEWLSKICKQAFIMTANHQDSYAGHKLHITNEPESFWNELISKYFIIINQVNRNDIWFFYYLESKENC